MASSLDFRLIDEEIVTRAAAEAGVDHSVVADAEKRKSLLSKLLESAGTAGLAVGYGVPGADLVSFGGAASDELRGIIRSAIEDTAAAGSAVIVSHAASLALSGRGDVLRILITAPTRTREQRLAAALGVEEKEAAQIIKRSDAGRADYIKRFYGVGAEEPIHYDLVINTDKLTPEAAASLIVQAAGGRTAAEPAIS